jgi:hypothetical protein
MLAPETRTLLTDALRPPDGFRLDVAVATTYSLDLHALLLAPLSFALHDVEGGDLDSVDPIRLLEAVRRYAERITVFCQAGAIHVPASYRRILTFAEDSVRQVLAPAKGRVFHPKIWVLRFTDTNGRRLHRFLCLSRNLTFDKSWDTLLRLDEDLEEGQENDAPDCAPLAEFVAALPDLGITPLESGRGKDILSLAESLLEVRFDLPSGTTGLTFLPLGLGPEPAWPFPARMDRLLAVTAFLDAPMLARLTTSAAEAIVVSRQESLDKAGPQPTDAPAQLFTLQRSAEADIGDDTAEPVRRLNEASDTPEGLHAKTFIAEADDRAIIVTGSANATTAGFGGNVEFDVVMEGPPGACGVAETWEGRDEAPGLSRLCAPYTPTVVPEDEAEAAAREWAIDQFHAQLAALPLTVQVDTQDDGRFALTLTPVTLTGPGTTRIWPISLPRQGFARPLDAAPRWAPIALGNITPFLAVETVDRVRDVPLARTSVIKAALLGDPPERRQHTLQEMLRDKRDVLRYLVFLLGDPAYDSWFGTGDGQASRWGRESPAGLTGDLVLFEPLVKAVARGDEAIQRVAGLVAELRRLDNAEQLLPDGFNDLWSAVWTAYGKDKR